MLPGETQVWSESSVDGDERNLYSTRSAIIGLAVETWRVKTELILITILRGEIQMIPESAYKSSASKNWEILGKNKL